jgi:hypothetical protein
MIVTVLLVLAGATLGCLTLLLLLMFVTLRLGRHGSRARVISRASEPRFCYNTRVPLTWFNTLCACVYPSLIDRDALASLIRSFFAGIPAGVPAIRRIRLRSFELSPTPPSFNGVALQTSVGRDEVDIDFVFALGLTMNCSVQFDVPVIGRVSSEVIISPQSLRGCFCVFVPRRCGPMRITIKRPRINIDFAVGVGGLFTINTAVIQPVWNILFNWFLALVPAMVVTIPLEEALARQERTTERRRETAKRGRGAGGGGRVRFRRYMELHPFDF